MLYKTKRDEYYGQILEREFQNTVDAKPSLIVFDEGEGIYAVIGDKIYHAQATSDDDAFYFFNVADDKDKITFEIPEDFCVEYDE